MTSKTITSFLAAGVIAIGALIPATAGADPTDNTQLEAPEQVTVRVVNNNWADMRVYVVQGRSRLVRLGTVTSFTTSKFRVPKWFNPDADQLQLVVRGLAGRSSAVAPILVEEGDVVEVRIENNIAVSNVRIVTQDN